MYAIFCYNTLFGVFTTPEQVTSELKERFSGYETQCLSRTYNRCLDAKEEATKCMTNLLVVEFSDTLSTKGFYAYRGNQGLPEGWIDVSNKFFSYEEEKRVVSHKVTATVTKKGLKSFGKEVTINNKVGDRERILEPIQIKELVDTMARVNVHCKGWGSMTLSPDSLGDFKSEAIYNTSTYLVIKEDL